MSGPSFEEIEGAFHELRELAATERPSRLAELRARDANLAAEVERLLELDTSASELDGRAWEAVQASAPGRIGPWMLEERLASGGMGLVWRARRDGAGPGEPVALKLLSPLLADTDFERRFRVERALLASLEHPNVARILDGGVTDQQSALPGLPYMAIELIDGPPIHEYCREQRLDTRARVRLFLQVVEGVDAAHRAMILHRDLKPQNILVERAGGTVKVLDFGVAMLLPEEPGGSPALATGTGLFTPAYASPEQLLGRPLDRTSDVYSLGVLLYELVADQHPFVEEATGGLEAALGRTERRPPALADPDLARVAGKAMAPEPADRYGSARELGDDLERWLEGRPVEARPIRPLLRALKFARRNPALTGALALAAAGILSAVLGMTLGMRRAETARAAVEESEQIARERREILQLLPESLQAAFRRDLQQYPEDEPVLSRLVLDTARALNESDASPTVRAAASIQLSDPLQRLGQPDAAREILESVLELEGEIPRRLHCAVRLNLARLLAGTGEEEAGRAQVEAILRELAESPTEAERALLADTHVERARQAARRGDEAGARGDLARAEELIEGRSGDRGGLHNRLRRARQELTAPRGAEKR